MPLTICSVILLWVLVAKFYCRNTFAKIRLRLVPTRPMTYTPPKVLTFEEFIAQYGDNTRYELIDGELRDMEPTGLHEAVAGSIAGRIYVEIFSSNFNWLGNFKLV